MHDVLIVDEEFDAAAKAVSEVCGKIDALVGKYLDILNRCTVKEVMDGETAESLRAFADYAERLRNEAGKLASSHEAAKKNFLTQVDDTDSYLYD